MCYPLVDYNLPSLTTKHKKPHIRNHRETSVLICVCFYCRLIDWRIIRRWTHRRMDQRLNGMFDTMNNKITLISLPILPVFVCCSYLYTRRLNNDHPPHTLRWSPNGLDSKPTFAARSPTPGPTWPSVPVTQKPAAFQPCADRLEVCNRHLRDQRKCHVNKNIPHRPPRAHRVRKNRQRVAATTRVVDAAAALLVLGS